FPGAVLSFDSVIRVHVGGLKIKVWLTAAAHTDGDSVVFFEYAKVLHMGDNFFHKVIPYIDVSAGGSVKGYLAMLDRMMTRVPANVTVIPGHGEVTDLAGLKSFRQELADVLEAARKAKAARRTKQQFLDEADFSRFQAYPGYADRFHMVLEAAYDDAK
ncbi:MAG: hypothetical protein H7X85_06340, partial [Thermoanaerobaculia bacterium]|nr:hypothetical protein [Thermoanaerobaculia bacterium]